MRMYLNGYSNPIETFSSTRTFRLWHMVVSHGVILIRSERDYEDSQSENIDLLFVATSYIELPETLMGIEITTPTSIELEYLKSHKDWLGMQEEDISYFMIVSEGKHYYVVAAYLNIYLNKLDPTENPYFGRFAD